MLFFTEDIQQVHIINGGDMRENIPRAEDAKSQPSHPSLPNLLQRRQACGRGRD